MKVQLLVPGKTRPQFVKEGVDFYASRIEKYISFKIIEAKERKGTSADAETMINKEGEQLLQYVKAPDRLILLDERGTQYTSRDFAHALQDWISHAPGNIIFLAGGAYGISDALHDRANAKVALSKMTLPHQLVRLLFAEQLYRAFTIINNHPYHH